MLSVNLRTTHKLYAFLHMCRLLSRTLDICDLTKYLSQFIVQMGLYENMCMW